MYPIFKIFTMRFKMWITPAGDAGMVECNLILDFCVISYFSTEIKGILPRVSTRVV
jgi:hypothetical protein